MRMSPTDIADVTGATYTYLLNGTRPGRQLDRPVPARRARPAALHQRLVDDVLRRAHPRPAMSVVAGGRERRVAGAVDELRIGVAETYDVIVEPTENARLHHLRPERGPHRVRPRHAWRRVPAWPAPIPPMDPRPMRTMADMGMGGMDMSGGKSGMSMGGSPRAEPLDHTAGMDHGDARHGSPPMPGIDHGSMPGMDHGSMPGMDMAAWTWSPTPPPSMRAASASTTSP